MNLKKITIILLGLFLTLIISCRETVKEDAHSDGHMENTEHMGDTIHMDDTDHMDLDEEHMNQNDDDMKDEEHH